MININSSLKGVQRLPKLSVIFVFIISLLFVLSCEKNSITPLPGPDPATLTDVDGNVYPVIRIGNQLWITENFRTTKYNDGTAIPLVTDSSIWPKMTTPGYCYYNNTTNADSITMFGALYNWYTVNTGKFAPAGWHVPNYDDWVTLQNYLIQHGFNFDGTTTNNKIAKALAAKSAWIIYSDPGVIGNDLTKNNSSGFSALPGGYRSNGDGSFSHIGNDCFFWSTLETDTLGAFSRSLDADDYRFVFNSYLKCYGLSVRLVKD
jgi:uncharacterized protein (TIGR02145 family)